MKLNNKGIATGAFIAFIVLFVFALALSVFLLRKNFKNDQPIIPPINPNDTVAKYKKNEESMATSAAKYVSTNYSDLVVGDKLVIQLSQIQEQKLIGTIFDATDQTLECDGYVTYEKKATSEDYKAFLKCGNNYTTDGYNN